MSDARRAEVSLRAEIPAAADEVWALISDFGTIDRYSPTVVACRLEGEPGVGQRRVLTLENGTITISRLEAIDHAARSLTYRILETKLPLDDYTSTMVVEAIADEAGDARCEVGWTSYFRPKDATLEEARGFLEAALRSSLRDLRAVYGGAEEPLA